MKRKALISTLCVLALLSFFIARPKADVTSPNMPVSLTNPDGQTMALVKYDLRVAVNGPLSLTEMEMTFRNPENRQMEGRFLYMLPPGATISRFAKEVNGKLMEGEVVEKMRAQQIYTEILHTMRDPALLETDQGNRFSARVFPIPANGTVRLLLGYSQLLPSLNGERKLQVPLAGLPKINDFRFNVVVQSAPGETMTPNEFMQKAPEANQWSDHWERNDFTPKDDILLKFAVAPNAPSARATKSGNFQMLSYRPDLPKAAGSEARDWAVYFDTSASNADNEVRRLQSINEFLMGLVPVLREKDTKFSAYAFDVTVKEIQAPISMNADGGSKPLMPRVVTGLRARHALGASNLAVVLKHIGDQARAAKTPTCFVLASDGIATLGPREARELVAALGEWPAQHVMHALVIGNKQDERALGAVVEKTRGRIVNLSFGGSVADMMQPDKGDNVGKAISELREPLGPTFQFYDEGAAWIYPKEFHDVRPGSELIVFSELKDGAPSKPGAFTQLPGSEKKMSKDFNVAPDEVADFAPLLKSNAYKAYLDHLEKAEQTENDRNKRAEIHKQRVDLSVKNRVLCPLTSLLVLETENDYRRYGIDRNGLAEIMIVGAKGIEMRKRGADEVPQVPPPAKPQQFAEKKSATKESVDALAKGKAENDKAWADGKAEEKTRTAADPGFGGGGGQGRPLADGAERRRGLSRDREETEELRKQLKDANADDNVLALQERGDTVRQGGLSAGREAREQQAQAAGERGIRQEAAATRAPGTPPPPAAAAAPEPARTTAGQPADQQNRGADAARANNAPPAPAERRTEAATLNGQPANAAAGAVAGKRNAPDWVNQGAAPTEDELNVLRAKVQASPRDRALRNAYADALLRAKQWDSLQGQVFEWLPFDPENPQVYEYLGRSAAGLNDPDLALRAYTSIAEIAPNRAALLARAGWLLLATKKYEMAEEMFREALKNRQDDCNIYRGLAMSLWLRKDFEGACKAYSEALKKEFNPRYGDVKRVLREELGYVVRAWQHSNSPDKEKNATFATVTEERLFRTPSDAFRATLCWETDANDVDLHVVDPNGEECFYSHKNNASGLELYSDQTQGLGPEVVRCEKAIPGTYTVGVNYFSAGPMGVSRGIVVIMQPKDGVVEEPQVIPFCLVPGGKDMRYLGEAKF